MNTSASGRRILHFDCFSGLAGDMILAALIDLGLPLEVVEAAVGKLPISHYRIRVEKEKRQSIMATRFFVDVEEHHQPHRHFSDIRKMIEDADISTGIKTRAVGIFEIIAAAEARVHGSTIDKVHFHEVGAVDSIVDIVGAAAALEHFGAAVTCTPVPLGNGMMKAAHGALPIPAPATLFILQDVPVTGTEIQAELTTPTGAAVIKQSAGAFGRFPDMVVEAVGFGAGARSHETRPGLLRAVLGRTADPFGLCAASGTYVVEANIDDLTGEIAAHTKTALFSAGALDVWVEPIQMKKERPALKVGMLCRHDTLHRLADVLFRESSTIGLRYYPVGRIELRREIRTVETRFGPIRIKVAKNAGGIANAAPEFEDCLAAAEAHGVPVKEVMAAAAGLAQELVSRDGA